MIEVHEVLDELLTFPVPRRKRQEAGMGNGQPMKE